MRIWKKINKGFLLTIIVLIVLIIYLRGVEKQREEDKATIKTTCEEYIKLVDELIVLPENMRTNSQNLTEDDKKKIQENINNELKKIMIDSKDAIEIQSQYLLENIEQLNYNVIVTNIHKTISEITKYEFYGDQVVVTFSTNYETTYKNIDEEEENKNIQSGFGEQITLQKLDGKWKIVYSTLDYYINIDSFYMY